MDKELLQQVLAMVGEAGEGGFTLAVIFLLEGYFTTLAVVSLIGFVVFRITRTILAVDHNQRAMRRIAEALNTGWVYIDAERAARLVQKVKDLKGDT